MIPNKIHALWFMLVLLTGCASMPQTERLKAEILAADRGVMVILVGTDQALLSGAITKAQAATVSALAHQVNPLLDAARAAIEASDTAGAEQSMRLVNALLAALNAYLPQPPLPPAH